jgi:hypothetical protein
MSPTFFYLFMCLPPMEHYLAVHVYLYIAPRLVVSTKKQHSALLSCSVAIAILQPGPTVLARVYDTFTYSPGRVTKVAP